MKDFTVSVVMITYNHQDYIEQAIKGVLMQECSFNVELIIANDNSPDISDQIITALIEKEDISKNFSIKYHCHGQNKGMTNNFIWALKQAKGKYTAICEGDDYWIDPLKLQKQVDFLMGNEDYVMCFTRFKIKNNNESELIQDQNGHYFLNKENVIEFDFEKFSSGWHIGTQTVMFKPSKQLFVALKKYKLTRDVHIYTELLMAGKGACLSDFCATYRLTGKGVHSSQGYRSQIKTGTDVYEEIYKFNKEINFLEVKYRTFLKIYLQQLATKKDALKYIGTAFRSYKLTGNLSYLKEDIKNLFETGYRGFKRSII